MFLFNRIKWSIIHIIVFYCIMKKFQILFWWILINPIVITEDVEVSSLLHWINAFTNWGSINTLKILLELVWLIVLWLCQKEDSYYRFQDFSLIKMVLNLSSDLFMLVYKGYRRIQEGLCLRVYLTSNLIAFFSPQPDSQTESQPVNFLLVGNSKSFVSLLVDSDLMMKSWILIGYALPGCVSK